MSLRIVRAFVALGLLGLAACGNSDEPAASGLSVADGAARFGDGDVVFVQGMIPHHEQAVEMADIALDPTVEAGEAVVTLATAVKAAQDPKIEMMIGWLDEWGQPMEMDTSDGHDMSSMEGMMSVEDMDALSTVRGEDFDRMWMEMMIRHHEGAIATAETAKADASNAEVLALADAVIAAQRAEIEEMEALLEG